jgi:hypothetical protein
MGIFNAPPPLDPNQLNNLNPPDFTTTGQQLTGGMAKVPWYLVWILYLWQWMEPGLATFLGAFFNAIQFFMSFLIKLLTGLQGSQGYGMSAMIASLLEDMLWVKVEADPFEAGYSKTGRAGEMAAVGGTLFGTLERELAVNGTDTQVTAGLGGAASFMGYLIEFAVRESNVGFFSELLPEWCVQFKGLRDYGENLARNLGLGRLGRRALQPLVNVLCTIPLQWYMNKTYTPYLPAPAEIFRGFNAGFFTKDQLDTYLSYHGIPLSVYGAIEMEYLWHPSASDAMNLERAGGTDRATVENLIRRHGYNTVDAAFAYDTAITGAVLSIQSRGLEYALLGAKLGGAGIANFEQVVNSMMLLPEEKAAWLSIAQLFQTTPHRALSVAQLEEAFIEGILTFSELEQGFQLHGYSPQDVQTLGLLTLLKQQKATKTKTGRTTAKHITEADLVKAMTANIISEAQFREGLTNLGYPADDIAILLALALKQSGQPGAPELPGVNPT